MQTRLTCVAHPTRVLNKYHSNSCYELTSLVHFLEFFLILKKKSTVNTISLEYDSHGSFPVSEMAFMALETSLFTLQPYSLHLNLNSVEITSIFPERLQVLIQCKITNLKLVT